MNEDILRFTQELLSHMLGVPRNSVGAARALQNQGLIQYRRGEIRILERQKLEGAACECYHIVKEELSHFLAAEHSTRWPCLLPSSAPRDDAQNHTPRGKSPGFVKSEAGAIPRDRQSI